MWLKCTVIYALKQNMAVTVPIFMKVTSAERQHMEIIHTEMHGDSHSESSSVGNTTAA